MFVPRVLLKRLYTFGSLENTDDGVWFSIRNRLSDAQLSGVRGVSIAGRSIPLADVRLDFGDGRVMRPEEITSSAPLAFALRSTFDVHARTAALAPGKYPSTRVPRDTADDDAPGIIAERQRFVERFANVSTEHLEKSSFDPHMLAEIIVGVVLAGELSPASAISSSDWVSSHERYGRNR